VDGKWLWGERHTWRSWNDHYFRNQDWFNHRIRLYQKNLPQEHHTVLGSSKPKKGPTTAAEEDADEYEEGCQRKRVSEAGDESAKRPKHDQGPRLAKKCANAQAGAVVCPSKRALSSGQRASSKTGTINQKAKRPPKSGPPPAENTNTEEEDEAGPVHSGDYSGEGFTDQEPDDDETEFNAMLTDGMDEEIHDL